jgi:PAS domain S-box-containing protein
MKGTIATEAVLRFFQGRRFWLTTLIILVLPVFVCTTAAWTWYIDKQAADQRQTSLDTLWQEQTIRSALEADQHTLNNWASDLAYGDQHATADFLERVSGLIKENQAIVAVDYLAADGTLAASYPAGEVRPEGLPAANNPIAKRAQTQARHVGHLLYSDVLDQPSPKWALVVPVQSGTRDGGAIVAYYDLNRLMEQTVPWWFIQRYDLELTRVNGARVHLHDDVLPDGTSNAETLAFGPADSGLVLKVARHDRGNWWTLIGVLALVILALGGLVVWLLRVLRRWLNERLLAQRALSDELRFREAMENSTVTGLVAFDLAGIIIYVNPAFCKMVGIAAKELVGLAAPFPFWPQEWHAQCEAAHRAMLKGDCPDDGHAVHFCRSDGAQMSISLYSSLLVDGRGVARGWMASLYDTTALFKERAELSASREQLQTVLAGLEAAVSVSAQDTAQLLFRNRHHADVFPMMQDGDCCLLPLHGVPTGISPISADYRDATSQHWYHLERRTIRWVDGALVLLDIVRDTTAERNAADSARERDELLQRTAKLASLAEFASGIAHELNQPLAAIANYSAVVETCLTTSPPMLGKVGEAAMRIGDESRRAGQIIHSLRGAIHKRASQTQVCDLRELLTEPLALLEPLMRRKCVKVQVTGRRRATMIKCDAVMIEQVLLNLIRNALEALDHPDGKLPRDAVVVRIESGNEGVTVTVSDRGHGIGDAGSLFQTFYTTKPEGMGLGLSICRTVVESHGGHLWAEPNPGGGARFSFRLPRSVLMQSEV